MKGFIKVSKFSKILTRIMVMQSSFLSLIKSLFIFSKEEKTIFLLSLLASLVARGSLLYNPGYAIDDYSSITTPIDSSVWLSAGRWGSALVNVTLRIIGVESVSSTAISYLFSLIVLAYSAILILRIWMVNQHIFLGTLISLIFILFPYSAEIYTFRVATFPFAFSILLSISSIYLATIVRGYHIIFPIFLFTLSLSFYQIVLNASFIVIVFNVVVHTVFLTQQNPLKLSIASILKNSKFIQLIITIGVGTFLYFVLTRMIQGLLNFQPSARSILLSFSDFPDRTRKVFELFQTLFFDNETLIPQFLKILLLIVLGLSSILWLVQIYKSKTKLSTRLIQFIVFYISIVLAAGAIVGILWGLSEWWPVPRVLFAAGFFWAGIFYVSHLLSTQKLKILVKVFLIIIVIGFIGVNNHIFADQIRLNQRDYQKANRIVQRLEMDPNFKTTTKLAYIGNSYLYQNHVKLFQGDMNISGLAAEWSKIALINEVSGYLFSPPDDTQLQIATQYCTNNSSWPSPGSTAIINNLVIVCDYE